jgi:hypothetical protein
MKVTGGCHCGQISYEAEVDPATIRVCHCTDCQKLTGTAFRTNIVSPPGTFRITRERRRFTSRLPRAGISGHVPSAQNAVRRSMPPRLERNPSTYGLRVGGIDQRAEFAPPVQQIWCRSTLSWSIDLRAVEKSDRQ